MDFAAGAGHEINNPLAVISGRAQLLLRDEADPERRQSLALIRAQAQRVHEMIADVMLFARPPQLRLQPVDLPDLIGRVLDEAAAESATRSVVVGQPSGGSHPAISLRRSALPDALPLACQADPVQLAVALRALVRNAIEAVADDGRVEVSVGRRGEWLEVAVTDDGPGIAPDEREHLFNPFYAARQAGRGLGMGLSKAWRIITMHGGQIAVENVSPHGARFTVRLIEG